MEKNSSTKINTSLMKNDHLCVKCNTIVYRTCKDSSICYRCGEITRNKFHFEGWDNVMEELKASYMKINYNDNKNRN